MCAKGCSVRGAGSAEGWAVNLLLVGNPIQEELWSGESEGALGSAEAQGGISPLPACFQSSLSSAKSCQMGAMMDLCRSRNDAALPPGKLL